MATSKLALPSRKLFASDIQLSTKTENPSNITGLNVWKITKPQFCLIFSIVWVQGTVIEVLDNKEAFLLNDGTGQIEVVKSSPVVQSQKDLCIGQYVLVVGEVIQASINSIVVRAMKIQDLSDENLDKSIWTAEVKHQKKFLASYYHNSEIRLEG